MAVGVMSVADFSHWKKWLLIASIVLYGILAIPFVWLNGTTYANLHGLSTLYCLLIVINAVYQILEASYIPLFMRAAAAATTATTATAAAAAAGCGSENVRRRMVLQKGSKVSVLGIVVANLGGIIALLIGIVITHTKGSKGSTTTTTASQDGYYGTFLLAISIAGAMTVVFGLVASFYIPSVAGKPKPRGFILWIPIARCCQLVRSIKQYPNAFLLCIAWALWNVTMGNFMSVFVLLFRTTLGVGSSDPEYTVYTFMSYVVSSVGSLCWMALYPQLPLRMKTWAYIFLGVSLWANFWGCLGISDTVGVGFKHRWEFWVFEVVYTMSTSALRCLNRVLYSTLLPEGEEAQFFGLEVMLGVAVGWIGNLVNATIQDRTGSDRYPFLPNLFLVVLSIAIYAVCDTERGMEQVSKINTGSDRSID